MKKSKKMAGFSLLELLVVVTLIAIVATLAVTRLSNIHVKSAEVLNMANVSRIGPAIEAFMTANERSLNRLDLVMTDKVKGTAGDYDTSPDYMLILTNVAGNIGLSTALINSSGVPLLAKYHLETKDVLALEELGLTSLMRLRRQGSDGNGVTTGDDGEWSTGLTEDPDTCLSIATRVERGLAVPCINAVSMGNSTDNTPLGALVYQSCGQDVRLHDNSSFSIYINGIDKGMNTTDVMGYLKENGGILLAFGIGQYASFIGNTSSGLDSAPVCSVMAKDTYRRYFLLIRLETFKGITRAQYAGVMDANGNTMKQLRAASK